MPKTTNMKNLKRPTATLRQSRITPKLTNATAEIEINTTVYMRWRSLPLSEFAASLGFPSFSLQTKIDAKPLNGRTGSRRLHKFYQFTPRGVTNFIFLAEYKYFGLVCSYLNFWINVEKFISTSSTRVAWLH